jgi:hypothetical protein
VNRLFGRDVFYIPDIKVSGISFETLETDSTGNGTGVFTFITRDSSAWPLNFLAWARKPVQEVATHRMAIQG